MRPEIKYQSSAEYPWMVSAPDGVVFCKSLEDVMSYANTEIRGYCDDGWNEAEVEQITIAKVAHVATKTNVVNRPDEGEINEEGCDAEGRYWGDFNYYCDYEMMTFAERAGDQDESAANV